MMDHTTDEISVPISLAYDNYFIDESVDQFFDAGGFNNRLNAECVIRMIEVLIDDHSI